MPKRYTSLSFDFHSPSEHTINGKSVDIEMQIHSQSDIGSIDSAISVLFSVNSFSAEVSALQTKIINSFF